MSQTFTPITKFNLDDPKSWASELALLDWDSSQICFNKRTFIEFLKSVNVEVGPNFTEINKLPKYATFGKLSAGEAAPTLSVAQAPAPSAQPAATVALAPPLETTEERWGANAVRPSRKVRDPPGGKQSIRFGDYEEPSAMIPPPREVAPFAADSQSGQPTAHANPEPTEERWGANAMRPSRKVRDPPGGKQSIHFGGYEKQSVVPPPRNTPQAAAPPPADDFDEWAPKQPSSSSTRQKHNPFERSEMPAFEPPRPSRRVRENPGGKSSMAALLSGGM